MTDPSAPPPGRPLGRRAFIGLIGAGVSSLLWGDAAWRGVSWLAAPATRALPSDVRAALPAPGGGWRIYTVNPPMPTFDAATWRLTIDGLVSTPLSLTYDELRSLPRTEQVADFHCVTGWSVPSVRWTGVRLRDLLEATGPAPGARALVFVSAEQPYVDTLTLEQARVPDAMVAYEMDGRPLTRPHGAPARLVMPRMYGYKGVKWVQRIVLSDRNVDGFWEQRGYDRDAWVGRSNGRA
jgi:DMSO/TMAO reductase YedYZ molybdopterin-dependent catalytic subunit